MFVIVRLSRLTHTHILIVCPISHTQRMDGSPMAYDPLESFTLLIVSIIASFPSSRFRRFSCHLTCRRITLRKRATVDSADVLSSAETLGPSLPMRVWPIASVRTAAINGLRCTQRRPAHRMQEEGSGRKLGTRQFDLRRRDALVHARHRPREYRLPDLRL